jgi:hypothetical protein
MGYRGYRWSRSQFSKNWHWRGAVMSRIMNWLLGRGYSTAAERRQALDAEFAQHRREYKEANAERTAEIRAFNRRMRAKGVFYVVECLVCGKRFTRKTETSAIKPHKDASGTECYGRTGYINGPQYRD